MLAAQSLTLNCTSHEQPSREAWEILGKLLHIADNQPPKARASAILKEMPTLFKGNKVEYTKCFEILGNAGILQPSSMPSFFEGYILISDPISRTDRSDLKYPIDWWAGSDGVNWEGLIETAVFLGICSPFFFQ